MEDSFYLATGRQLWDASSITGEIVFARGALDFWSRPDDGVRMQTHAVRARAFRLVTIAEATHHLHLDRGEHGRNRLLDELRLPSAS
jgi:hypothetical protein